MLEELRICGLGVIAEATLPLGPGLTVVTGETGAGKTMVVAGLGLLFGDRGDPGRVRSGTPHALVEGRLRLPAGSVAATLAEEAGAELDEDGTLLAGRTVSAQGRSRAQLGGRSVPVAVLAELGAELIAISGQRDHLRLLRPREQLAALDRFAGESVTTLLTAHRRLYDRWRAVTHELAERRSTDRERRREIDDLQRAVDAIAAVEPRPGEDLALRAEAQRLEYADALRTAAGGAAGTLAADPTSDEVDVATLLVAARRSLESVAGHDASLDALNDRVAELGFLAADVAGDLARYADSVEADRGRLAQVNERRAELQKLLRSYGDDIDGVLAWAERARDRLEALDGSVERLAVLAAERDAVTAELTATAIELSRAREQAGGRFAAAVTAELPELALPQGKVEVDLARLPAADDAAEDGLMVAGELIKVGPTGLDEVELLFVAHAGAPARPLAKAASGGELSRVMLAIGVVFAAADPAPTMVFDEVDAGVGGRAAVEVGRRLARLSATHQVLAVTHLPQIAAFADRHLVVSKGDDGSVTAAGVYEVTGVERVSELSRMLAGLADSATGLAHAEELLRTARGDGRVSVGSDHPPR